MKKTNVRITQYEHREFIINIEETKDEFMAFIRRRDYGVQLFAFSMDKKQNWGTLTSEKFYNLLSDQIDGHESYYDMFMEENFTDE